MCPRGRPRGLHLWFEPKRAFGSENLLLGVLSKILADLKTNFTTFELSTTFRFKELAA